MNTNFDIKFLTSVVRGTYDLQKSRIQFGNRITGNYKAKSGLTNEGMTEKDLDKEVREILTVLRKSYSRLTDGLIMEGELGIVNGTMPKPKNFKGDGVIDTYTELALVDQYMTLLKTEKKQFDMLPKLMEGIPIYDKFLSKVDGCGPQMAAIILSEIDIHKAEYPSSLHQLAGLGVVTVAVYTNKIGNVTTVPVLDVYIDINGNVTKTPNPILELQEDGSYLAEGKYKAEITTVGMSRNSYCLVKREYRNKEGNIEVRNSITFSPILKTKLIGVLSTSFLKRTTTKVNGDKISVAERLALAKSLGFIPTKPDKSTKVKGKRKNKVEVIEETNDVEQQENESTQVLNFLRDKGYTIEVSYSKYGAHYYDYKNRLKNHPKHMNKSNGHQHAMALRFMIKRFLTDLYVEWRTIEGLPVAEEYSAAKLGMTHGVAGGGKPSVN
jgi:hypothetical protein